MSCKHHDRQPFEHIIYRMCFVKALLLHFQSHHSQTNTIFDVFESLWNKKTVVSCKDNQIFCHTGHVAYEHLESICVEWNNAHCESKSVANASRFIEFYPKLFWVVFVCFDSTFVVRTKVLVLFQDVINVINRIFILPVVERWVLQKSCPTIGIGFRGRWTRICYPFCI